MANLPLRFVRDRRQLRRRQTDANIMLIPLIDVMIALTLFLLALFAAGGAGNPNVDLACATHGMALIEAPLVVVTANQLLVDGVPVENSREVLRGERLTLVPELVDQLRAKRDFWRQIYAGRPAPDVIVVMADRAVPVLVIKSVVQSAAAAGFPAVSFGVKRR